MLLLSLQLLWNFFFCEWLWSSRRRFKDTPPEQKTQRSFILLLSIAISTLVYFSLTRSQQKKDTDTHWLICQTHRNKTYWRKIKIFTTQKAE